MNVINNICSRRCIDNRLVMLRFFFFGSLAAVFSYATICHIHSGVFPCPRTVVVVIFFLEIREVPALGVIAVQQGLVNVLAAYQTNAETIMNQ